MNYSLETLKDSKFRKYVLDIGTGDGRFVYKNALTNPDTFYLGIDPASNLKEYQREINRKKLNNAGLINASIENFNPHVSEFFDLITIILPWGNLLKYAVTVDLDFFSKITSWLKKNGEIEIIFGFNEELEEKQTKRLNLPDLTEKEIEYIKKGYGELQGLELKEFKEIIYKELLNLETSWAKKLSYGKNRKYLYIKLKKFDN